MRKLVLSVVVLFAAVSVASADEPNLSDLGLGGLEAVSDAAGSQVRGLAPGTHASGLSNLAAIFYDVDSGSKANVDLVNFSQGEDATATASATGGLSQNYNQIGIGAALTLTFAGSTGGITAFSAGGASQNVMSVGTATPAVITINTPTAIPN